MQLEWATLVCHLLSATLEKYKKQNAYHFPTVEMHAAQFGIVWFCNVNVEGLTLVNERSTISSHLDNSLLGDLPDGFV